MHTNKKIEDIADISSGIYLKTAPDGEVAYLQVKDFFMEEPIKMASKVRVSDKIQKNLLRDKDILFASKGSAYLATCYKEEDGMAVASTAFFIIRIYDENVLPEYLCWFLNQRKTKTYINSQKQGTSVPVIRKGVVEYIDIPIPDLTTQRNIVALGQLSEREYKLRKAIAQKKQLLIEEELMKIIK